MRLPRFFVSPDVLATDVVRLSGDVAHQIHHVLRLHAGERVMLLDDAGSEYETELLTVTREQVMGRIVERRTVTTEPRAQITLYPALLKADKFEWVLQKGTELGIAAFHPMVTERCVTDDVSAKKLARWRGIVREAAEQCGRGRAPTIAEPMDFMLAVRLLDKHALSLIPHEQAQTHTLRERLQTHTGAHIANLFIGPEGGFTDIEVDVAHRHRVKAVTLGKRILRAETASLVAATIILHEWGELG
jgi:16S rRNA (uracil1498-N3)-methyltransferase